MKFAFWTELVCLPNGFQLYCHFYQNENGFLSLGIFIWLECLTILNWGTKILLCYHMWRKMYLHTFVVVKWNKTRHIKPKDLLLCCHKFEWSSFFSFLSVKQQQRTKFQTGYWKRVREREGMVKTWAMSYSYCYLLIKYDLIK